MEQLICKKNYYDTKLDFDGKNYWSVLWGRRMYKITPKPLFEKNKIYNAEVGAITSTPVWYLIKCNNSHRMFTDNTFEYFYTKEEILKILYFNNFNCHNGDLHYYREFIKDIINKTDFDENSLYIFHQVINFELPIWLDSLGVNIMNRTKKLKKLNENR